MFPLVLHDKNKNINNCESFKKRNKIPIVVNTLTGFYLHIIKGQ